MPAIENGCEVEYILSVCFVDEPDKATFYRTKEPFFFTDECLFIWSIGQIIDPETKVVLEEKVLRVFLPVENIKAIVVETRVLGKVREEVNLENLEKTKTNEEEKIEVELVDHIVSMGKKSAKGNKAKVAKK
jgi:hypothetical protein